MRASLANSILASTFSHINNQIQETFTLKVLQFTNQFTNLRITWCTIYPYTSFYRLIYIVLYVQCCLWAPPVHECVTYLDQTQFRIRNDTGGAWSKKRNERSLDGSQSKPLRNLFTSDDWESVYYKGSPTDIFIVQCLCYVVRLQWG